MLKGDLVQGAYEQLKIWGLTVSAVPEETQLALKRLNGMLLHWESKGIYLGWVVGDDSPNDESGLPDWAQEAVFTNLALKLMPAYGKTPTQLDVMQARESLLAISLSDFSNMEYPDTMPVGAGNQRYGYSSRRFFVESDPDAGVQSNAGEDINL